MHSTKQTFAVCSVLFFVGIANAQTADRYEHLKGLEPFVGTWEGKFDPPGDAPEGRVRIESSWICNKAYLQVRGFYTPDADGAEGIKLNPANVLIGYNGKTKSTYSWHFEMGAHMHGPAEVLDKRIVMKIIERVGDSGSRGTRTVTFELSGPDEIAITHTDIVRNGKKQPDDEPLVAKRMK